VAQNYLPQRHLVGPALFPIYSLVLKIAALGFLAPWMVVWLSFVVFVPSYRAAHPGLELIKTLATFWNIAFYTFGLITAGFAVGERVRQKYEFQGKWEPQRLPRVHDIQRIPRVSSVAEFVFGIVFLFFWLGFVEFPAVSINGTAARLTLGPVWQSFHQGFLWPIAVLALVSVAMACVNLFRPYWTRPRLAIRGAANAVASGILFSVAGAHWPEVRAQWANLTASTTAVQGIASIQNWLNIGVIIALVIAGIICVGECIWDVRRFFKAPSP
jgi:hypothetical protein